MTLAIHHKVSAWSFLHPMCTCRTLLHPTCTSRTCSYSSVMLAIHHKSLRLVLCPSNVYCGTLLHLTRGTWRLMCHMYLWDLSPSPSDLWNPTACVSRVPMGPFSISIWPMGLDGLHVSCTYGTFLHLHLTYGTRRLKCHLWTLLHLTCGTWSYVSCVLVVPFSISIWPVGPDGLRVTCTLCATRV
jgi:hypothetical protein